jgi:hypothetical protein
MVPRRLHAEPVRQVLQASETAGRLSGDKRVITGTTSVFGPKVSPNDVRAVRELDRMHRLITAVPRLPPPPGAGVPAMARPAAVTSDQIRATVLAMLAQAGDCETVGSAANTPSAASAPLVTTLPPRGVGAAPARTARDRRPCGAVAGAERDRGRTGAARAR